MSTELIDERLRQRRFTLRWIGLILLLMVFGVALSALLLVTSQNRGAQAALNEKIAGLRASGQPVAFADLDPRLDGKSFQQGQKLLRALEQLPPMTNRFQQLYDVVVEKPRTLPEGLDAFEEALAEGRPLRDQIVALIREAPVYLPHDYATTDPWMITLEELQQLRECCRQMSLEQSLAMARGERDLAAALVLDEWDLETAFQQEPFLVSHLVRIALMNIAMEDAEHLLGRLAVTDAWRQEFDTRMQACEATTRLAPVVASEAAMNFTMINTMRETGIADRVQMMHTLGHGNAMQFVPIALGIGLARDQEEVLTSMQAVARLIDVPGPQATAQLAAHEAQGEVDRQNKPLANLLHGAINAWRNAGLRARQAALSARLAWRVDRYYREQGTFPESLDNVLDDTLTAVPLGLFSGAPLCYEHDEDSFVIFDPGVPAEVAEMARFEVHYGEPKSDEPSSSMEPTLPELDLPLEPEATE